MLQTFFQTIRNAFKMPELRNRIMYTLFILLIYRLGTNLAVLPGISEDAFAALGSAAGALDIVSNFSKVSIFSMGVMPYITASIIMQLLTMIFPAMERMMQEGYEGRKKYNKITKYLAVVLCVIQSIGLTLGFTKILSESGTLMFAVLILGMTTGSMILLWFGERITEKGLGNGVSLIILIGILARLPQGVQALYTYATTGKMLEVSGLLVAFVAMIAFVVVLQQGERKIHVQYAKRVGYSNNGFKSNIPMKVNLAGVMPVIFAMSILQFPTVIATIASNMGKDITKGAWVYLKNASDINNPVSAGIYIFLIFFFAYFFTTSQFNTAKVAEGIKKSAGFIPGIRPGKETIDYLDKVLACVTLVGAAFIAVVAIAPVLLGAVSGIKGLYFGGTSLLIAVGVALDTVKQMESKLVTRNYKGFLN